MAWGAKRMTNLIDMLFGCRHKQVSFPMTSKRGSRRSAAASLTGTYVVCLECGKEFPYDWSGMKIIDHPPVPTEHIAANPSESWAAK